MKITERERAKSLGKPKEKRPHTLLGTGKGYFTGTLKDGTKVYTVQVRHNYKVQTIGRFATEERARSEYLKAIKNIKESYETA